MARGGRKTGLFPNRRIVEAPPVAAHCMAKSPAATDELANRKAITWRLSGKVVL
jgi:hypothetical protein